MITKAGVPPSKLYVGIASYGRSFRISDPACTGLACTFTGSFSVSEAERGHCTETGGYNGTIGKAMTDWVAYMEDATKKDRVEWIRSLNLGGTTDWAIDLANWHEGPQVDGGWSVKTETVRCIPEDWPTTLEDLEKNIGRVPVQCRGMATIRIMSLRLQTAITQYHTVSKFGWFADWVKDAINDRLEEFMAIRRGKGLQYMDCEWSTRKNSGKGPCTEATLEYELGLHAGPRRVSFTMRDEAGFYKAQLENTGIQKEWITWRDHTIPDSCPCGAMKKGSCANEAFCRSNAPHGRRTDLRRSAIQCSGLFLPQAFRGHNCRLP
ncbi:hypothetical protein QQS21_000382 [Conoideocrella luteorostrata]|uniref:GH18 domain-containing protein n=1 Tax=Conoideocrella luteorostrata TaxID=1105319 RepID=A0AAJ0D1G3_9HYPO|nr:hypothetical protein QQS21_000382 [Conoideocrella luteorostrata]